MEETASSKDCSVRVAVHIRPLIGDERLQGCKECVTVVPGKRQVQVGTHSFTFDHVYGESGSSSASMFEDCVVPLVDGFFQGYNGTVLAYGQTGSGKTYTMGTGFKDGCQTGLIPQVMNALFNKIEMLKNQTEYQLHVSFIEILKEEVRDLLDSTSVSKADANQRHAANVTVPGKPPIQIRETSNGVITLAGSTEVSVSTVKEMVACLEQGSFTRATGSTNMNNQSSRSHAIFTITLEQMRKLPPVYCDEATPRGDMDGDYLCAKLHLVDLAGSERAKRTGAGGIRLKEGIHINKGLLALGNVISALGDEKKRKEGVHVPYRDSKLTRLLQDSLGGNSKTVMIACVSPADINAEETHNTLKYANRARNIQNKPIVNRDLLSSEIHTMRRQLEYLQEQLSISRKGVSSDEVQVLRERISWLETTNKDLSQALHQCRSRCAVLEQCEPESQEGCNYFVKKDGLKRGLQSMNSNYPMGETIEGENYREADELSVKEWEHTLLQNTMDIELNELNKRLEHKESEMKLFGWTDTEALKQHYGKKVLELEEEKRIVQEERDCLLAEIERLATCDGATPSLQIIHTQKLEALEVQLLDLKKKQESQLKLLKRKQKSDEAAKRLQHEIHSIKAQKVQLQHKIKQEAERFREWKASHEKELLQLRKEGRRNEYERHKLQALNQRQKMVVQRKTEEAAMATKRLKQLLEVRKCPARDNLVYPSGSTPPRQSTDKTLQGWIDHELDVMVNVQAVRSDYRKQQQAQAALAEELAALKQVGQLSPNGLSPLRREDCSRLPPMSPNACLARITSLEHMLSSSTDALIPMASQLSEAERRERGSSSRRWNLLRSMGDAKRLLRYMFTATVDARYSLMEMELEIKDMKMKLNELVTILQQNEVQRKETIKEQKLKEQAVAIALAISSLGKFPRSLSSPCLRMLPAPKQLKHKAGIANRPTGNSAMFLDQSHKTVPIGNLSMKKEMCGGQRGKLWRWKRSSSHHQWLLQFKWKWQKPWKLSEWIRQSDEIVMSSGNNVIVR